MTLKIDRDAGNIAQAFGISDGLAYRVKAKADELLLKKGIRAPREYLVAMERIAKLCQTTEEVVWATSFFAEINQRRLQIQKT